MVFNEEVQSITNDTLMPKVADNVSDGSVLLKRVLTNIKSFRGTSIKKSVKWKNSTNGGSFSGLEKFNTNLERTKIQLSFNPKAYEQPVVIPGLERDINASVSGSIAQAAGLVAEALDEATIDMSEALADMLFSDGTGNGGDDFQGLQAIIDDGGEVATYGGKSRTTYSVLQANEEDLSADITLAKMGSTVSLCTKGRQEPTIIITTKAVWDDFETLHTSSITNNFDKMSTGFKVNEKGTRQGLHGDKGFRSLSFRGIPVVYDEACPSGKMFFINEDWLSFYGLKSSKESYKNIPVGRSGQIEGVYGDGELGGDIGFQWSGLLEPEDQYGEVGHIFLFGELVSFQPRLHAVLNSITVS